MKIPSYMRPRHVVAFIAGLGGLVTAVDVAYAQNWTVTYLNAGYATKALASSADGTKLAVVVSDVSYGFGPAVSIVSSTNAGLTWTRTSAPANQWTSIALSADGAKQVAAAETYDPSSPGLIYTSADSGGTWRQSGAPTNGWLAVASSADATKLAAAAQIGPAPNNPGGPYYGDGLIYTSTNSGATWTPTRAPSNYWSSVVSSADGTKLVALTPGHWEGTNFVEGGALYFSLDSGTTWKAGSGLTNPACVVVSADGTRAVAAVQNGPIAISTDAGGSWTFSSAPTNQWDSVACSADGTKLVASGNDLIYTSTDAGTHWNATPVPPSYGFWYGVGCTADGDRIVALNEYDYVATLVPQPPSPLLSIALKGSGLGISWLVPSGHFVLQQNLSLSPAHWEDMTNQPSLNSTNLHNELILPLTQPNEFFRLEQK